MRRNNNYFVPSKKIISQILFQNVEFLRDITYIVKNTRI